MFNGCSSKTSEGEALDGKVTLAGSTSMKKLCEALSESFMADNPGVTVTVEYTGSRSEGKHGGEKYIYHVCYKMRDFVIDHFNYF